MPTFTGNFETGVQGNTIAITDAASNTIWDDRAASANATLEYSNEVKHGALSCKMVLSATPGSCHVAWDSTTLGTSMSEFWGRIYLRQNGLPNTLWIAVRGFDTGSRSWEMAINSSGFVLLRDTVGTIRAQGTVATPVDQWFRIEYHVIDSTTNGLLEARLYNNADSTQITESITSTGSFSTLTRTDLLRMGEISGINASRTLYMDNIQVNTGGWPGPDAPQRIMDSFSRSVTDGWGVSDSGYAWNESTNDAGSADVNGSVGTFTLTAAGSGNSQSIDMRTPNVEGMFKFAISNGSTGHGERVSVTVRKTISGSNFGTRFRVQTSTSDRLELDVFEVITGDGAGSVVIANPYVYGDQYYLRFVAVGTSYLAKAWKVGSAEPANWLSTFSKADRDSSLKQDYTLLSIDGERVDATTGAVYSIDDIDIRPVTGLDVWADAHGGRGAAG